MRELRTEKPIRLLVLTFDDRGVPLEEIFPTGGVFCPAFHSHSHYPSSLFEYQTPQGLYLPVFPLIFQLVLFFASILKLVSLPTAIFKSLAHRLNRNWYYPSRSFSRTIITSPTFHQAF